MMCAPKNLKITVAHTASTHCGPSPSTTHHLSSGICCSRSVRVNRTCFGHKFSKNVYFSCGIIRANSCAKCDSENTAFGRSSHVAAHRINRIVGVAGLQRTRIRELHTVAASLFSNSRSFFAFISKIKSKLRIKLTTRRQ